MAVPSSDMITLWHALHPDATSRMRTPLRLNMVCGSHKFGPPEFPRDDRTELSDSSLFPYKINLGIPRNSLEFLKNSLEFLRMKV